MADTPLSFEDRIFMSAFRWTPAGLAWFSNLSRQERDFYERLPRHVTQDAIDRLAGGQLTQPQRPIIGPPSTPVQPITPPQSPTLDWSPFGESFESDSAGYGGTDIGQEVHPLPPPPLPGGSGHGGPPLPKPPGPIPVPLPPGDGGGGGQGGGGGGGGGQGGGECCACPPGGGGGGGPGGGGGGGGGGQQCIDGKNLCKRHDGTLLDLNTATVIEPDGNGCYMSDTMPAGCDAYVCPDMESLPYCDDVPCQAKDQPKPAKDCCDAAMKAIADAVKYMADKIADKGQFSCDKLDGCIDYLAGKLRDKIIPPAKTCDECCKRVELGIVMASECATLCAGAACSACLSECTGIDDGKCCSGCGQKECVCKDYKCIPKEQPKDVYHAWCNGDSGDTKVTKNDEASPGPQYQELSQTYDTEQAATDAAKQYCQQSQPPQPIPSPGPPIIPIGGGHGFYDGICETGRYRSRLTAQAYLAGIKPPSIDAAVRDTLLNSVKGLVKSVDAEVSGSGILSGLFSGFTGPIAMASAAADLVSATVGCSPAVINDAFGALAVLGIAEHWTGIDVGLLKLPLEYGLNAACRPRIMSPEQAVSAVLSNTLPVESLDRHFAAAGYCELVSDSVLIAEMAKPVPAELIRLRRREIISEQEYLARMRQIGYMQTDVVQNLYKATEILPSLSEILHMMIRDADNQPIIDEFRFADRFEDKFGPQLKEWTRKQGIPDEVVKRNYYSHWDIPSKTELFEFWRRLRNLPDGNPAKITEHALRAALTHNNILPRWFDSYLAIAFQPLGRIDIRRSYQQGTLSDDDCKQALQQLGYNDDNIDRLFKFMQRLKDKSAVTHEAIKEWSQFIIGIAELRQRMSDDGYTDKQIDKAVEQSATKLLSSDVVKAFVKGHLTQEGLQSLLNKQGVSQGEVELLLFQLSFIVRDIATVGQYSSGVMTRAAAISRMEGKGMNNTIAQAMIDDADDAFRKDASQRCQRAVKKRFLTGGLDTKQAVGQLISNGIVQEYADRLVDTWKCELSTKDKTVAAGILCGWLSRGAITAHEFVNRMVRVGYVQSDAMELLGDCTDRIATQHAKKEAQQAKENAAVQAKAEAKSRRAQAAGEKALRAVDTARKAKAALRATRQTQLLTAARKLSNKCLCDDSAAVDAVYQNSERLQRADGFTLDESIRTVLQAVEAWNGGDPKEFDGVVDAMAKLVKATEGEVVVPEPA